LVSLMQLYPVNFKVMTIEFCAVDKNESDLRLSGNNESVCLQNKSSILNGNFRDFSKRGPGIWHLQNENSRWPWRGLAPTAFICRG